MAKKSSKRNLNLLRPRTAVLLFLRKRAGYVEDICKATKLTPNNVYSVIHDLSRSKLIVGVPKPPKDYTRGLVPLCYALTKNGGKTAQREASEIRSFL